MDLDTQVVMLLKSFILRGQITVSDLNTAQRLLDDLKARMDLETSDAIREEETT